MTTSAPQRQRRELIPAEAADAAPDTSESEPAGALRPAMLAPPPSPEVAALLWGWLPPVPCPAPVEQPTAA